METDIDEIEKDIIWRKLKGEYYNHYDIQHIFSPNGADYTFSIPIKSPHFAIQVVLNGYILTAQDYILDVHIVFLNVHLHTLPQANSMLIFNINYK